MKIKRVHVRNGRYFYIQDLEERYSSGKPKQKWHALTRVDEGEQAMLDARDKLLGKPHKKVGNMPALLKLFRADHLPGLTPDVCKEYERMYDFIALEWEEFDVDQAIPGDVLTFLQDNFSAKLTARRHYKARLSTFFSWCVLNDHCATNPCREIKLKAPVKRKGRMNAGNYWKMFDALPAMGQCFLELTYLTRQRPTEIRLLRESAILETHIHFEPTKTEDSSGEEVDILITPAIRRALDRARSLRKKAKAGQPIELQRKRDPFIIQSEDGGHFTRSGLFSTWTRARKAAGVKGVTTRDIRPYALHEMEAAGYSLRDIQLSAAHASVTTTEGYLEQHRDRISEAAIDLPQRPKQEKP